MNSPEKSRSWQKDYSRTTSRREFLQILVAAGATGTAISLGVYEWGKWNSGLSNEQELAQQTFSRAEKEGNVTEFELVNPDEKNGDVNIRKSPALLNGNRIDMRDVGDKFDGFLVRSVGGREKFDPELAGPWVAVSLDPDKMGFVQSRYVERVDGKGLTEGLGIYDLHSGEVVEYP